MYWQQTDLRDVASLCFFSLQFVTMSQLFAVPQLFAERPLFLRERAAGITHEAPYLLAKWGVSFAQQVPRARARASGGRCARV